MSAAQTSDAAAGLDTSGGVLAEIEAQLRAPDSVLEPGVLELLKEYLRAGGKPQSAIEDLSENYAGYAQMCDALCQWLEIADVRLSSSSSGSSSMNSITGLAAASATVPAAATAVAGAVSDGEVPDEFMLLQDLAKERFDPTKYLGAFRRGPPEWLNMLIKDSRGRRLIYQLSATHRNSLLLNYAIQKILKEGHENEVAMVGGSLASYFEVYHRLLASRITAAAAATTSRELEQISAAISESCVGSQHTYVHAQQLLTAAAGWPGGGVYRRLSQEVEAAAVAKHGGAKVYQLQPLFAPADAKEGEVQAIQLVSTILVRSAAGLPGSAQTPHPAAAQQLAAVDDQLQQLQQLYQQEKQLLVQPLRHPHFMELLLSGLFRQGKPLAEPNSRADLRAVCIQLLALAVAGRGPQDQEQGPSPAAAAAAVVGNGVAMHNDLDGTNDDEATGVVADADDTAAAVRGVSPVAQQQQQQQQQQQRVYSVAEVSSLLQQALELAGKVSAPAKLKAGDLEVATEVCKTPVAALGLLHRSQQLLSDENTYADEKINIVLPNHLSLLHRVACEQHSLIPQVLVVLQAVLTSLGSNKQELSKAALNFLVSLIVSGAADLALESAKTWASSADPSLVRHFIQLVLETVAPPYSQPFARIMISIMHFGLITRMKATHRPLLYEFARACHDVSFLPQLNAKDQDLLEELLRP